MVDATRMDTSRHGRLQRPSYSLRILFGCFVGIAVILGVIAHKLHRAKQQTVAVAKIRELGGIVPYENTRTGRNLSQIEDKCLVRLLGLDAFVFYPYVDLSDPSLSEEALREMTPYLRKLIPVEGMVEAGRCYVSLSVRGNPNVTEAMVEEMRLALPNCEFSTAISVAGIERVVRVGMDQTEVINAAGCLAYEQFTHWEGDKQPIVTRLGTSEIRQRYKTPGGLESWTYYTDEIGIKLFGIDFDQAGKVVSTWFARGEPPADRKLIRLRAASD